MICQQSILYVNPFPLMTELPHTMWETSIKSIHLSPLIEENINKKLELKATTVALKISQGLIFLQ